MRKAQNCFWDMGKARRKASPAIARSCRTHKCIRLKQWRIDTRRVWEFVFRPQIFVATSVFVAMSWLLCNFYLWCCFFPRCMLVFPPKCGLRGPWFCERQTPFSLEEGETIVTFITQDVLKAAGKILKGFAWISTWNSLGADWKQSHVRVFDPS